MSNETATYKAGDRVYVPGLSAHVTLERYAGLGRWKAVEDDGRSWYLTWHQLEPAKSDLYREPPTAGEA